MASWYYVKDKSPVGPLPEEQLVMLRQNGVVTDATLVWTKGLANWTRFSEQFPQAMTAQPAAPAPPPPPAEAMQASASPVFAASSALKAPGVSRQVPPGPPSGPEAPQPAPVPDPTRLKPPKSRGAPRWEGRGSNFELAPRTKPVPRENRPMPGGISQRQILDAGAGQETSADDNLPNNQLDEQAAASSAERSTKKEHRDPADTPWDGKAQTGLSVLGRSLSTNKLVPNTGLSEKKSEQDHASTPDEPSDSLADTSAPVASSVTTPSEDGRLRDSPLGKSSSSWMQARPDATEQPAIEGINRPGFFRMKNFPGQTINPEPTQAGELHAGGKIVLPTDLSYSKLTEPEPELRQPQRSPEPGRVKLGERLDEDRGPILDAPDIERVKCKECGKDFPKHMVDRYGMRSVCKLCQARLREEFRNDEDAKRERMFGPLEKAVFGAFIIGAMVAVVYIGMRYSFELLSTEWVNDLLTKRKPATEWISKEPEEWPPLVGTNNAVFPESTALLYGSSFLLKDRKENIMIVICGAASSERYGVIPPLNIEQIASGALTRWRLQPLDSSREKASGFMVWGENPLNYVDTPIAYLIPDTLPEQLPTEPLVLETKPIRDGDEVYLVIPEIVTADGQQSFEQRVVKGTVSKDKSAGEWNVSLKLQDAVYDDYLPGSPIIDDRGNLVGVAMGIEPWNASTVADFDPFKYIDATGRTRNLPERTQRLTDKIYFCTIKAFPKNYSIFQN